MAKETDSKGSNLIQLRISDKMREELQKMADDVGLPLTTYIYVLLANKIEEKQKP